MKIFIDFDDVIFNTSEFVKDLKKKFYSFGVSEELFQRHYYDPKEKDKLLRKYSPERQIDRISKEIEIDSERLKKEVENIFRNTNKYIFSDAEPFLKNFDRKNLYLISFGDKKTQKRKIDNLKIIRYFNQVKILQGKKSEVIKKLTGKEAEAYFIDDRTKFMDDVKKSIQQIKTILFKRKEGRYNDKRNKYCDFEAENFKEALKIINMPMQSLG